MILLDTHIWYWFLDNNSRLNPETRSLVESSYANGQAHVSIISVWEIAQKVRAGKLELNVPFPQWAGRVLGDTGFVTAPITPLVISEATELPGSFHKDPADRLIVATARILDCPLVTADKQILSYPHVRLIR